MSKIVLITVVLSVAAVAGLASSSAYAQTAFLTGTVTDPGGGVLPGVSVTITEVQTSASRTSASDEHGNYRVPFLPPGRYRIEAGLPGFKTDVRENVVLSVDDRLRVDFTLQIGEVDEKLIVTATTPLAQSETSSVGTVIDNQKVVELPLNGREFEDLSNWRRVPCPLRRDRR